MKKTLLSLAVATLSFSACDNSSSVKSKTQEELIQEATTKLLKKSTTKDYTKLIKPESFTVIKENIGPDEKKKMYTIGCITAGSYQSLFAMDKDLKVGAEFVEEWGSDSIYDAYTTSKLNKKITSVNSNILAYEGNYDFISAEDFPLTKIDQVFKKKPHSKAEISYTYMVNANSPEMDFKNDFLENLTPEALKYVTNRTSPNSLVWRCQIDYSKNDYKLENTTQEIQYSFKGQKINAFNEIIKTTGNIICELYNKEAKKEDVRLKTVEMGQGTHINTTISSNDVVSKSLTECGGEKLYRSDLITLGNGKVIDSSVNRLTSAPIRTNQ